MKKLLPFLAVFSLVGIAYAYVTSIENMDHQRRLPQAFHKGIYVTTSPADDSTARLANKLTSVLGGTITVDFPNISDGGILGCNDSLPISVPGANLGDACSIGLGLVDGGTANGIYSCYVSYADYARVRHCASNTDDPPSQTFYIRIFGR